MKFLTHLLHSTILGACTLLLISIIFYLAEHFGVTQILLAVILVLSASALTGMSLFLIYDILKSKVD